MTLSLERGEKRDGQESCFVSGSSTNLQNDSVYLMTFCNIVYEGKFTTFIAFGNKTEKGKSNFQRSGKYY